MKCKKDKEDEWSPPYIKAASFIQGMLFNELNEEVEYKRECAVQTWPTLI
jgi:hypothetical protein